MTARQPPTLEVTFFHRRPKPGGNFSLEFIFDDVRRRLADVVVARKAVASFESSGIARRLAICLEARSRQGDVNHVTGDVNFVGLALDPRRTIQTILDCGHLERTRGLKHQILRWLWVELPVRRCAAVTVISEATRQELLRYVPSCDPAKVHVIPVAISQSFQRRDKEFSRSCPTILQVGAAPNKNLARLAQALRGLDCRLEIIGSPTAEAQEALRGCGVRFRARAGLSADEVVRAYEEADLVSFASTYEGFGMPILEAQTVGRAVVTSDLLSMPWVAGGAACLVDPTDVASIRAGLRRVIEDGGYRQGLLERGFENVKRFDPRVIAGQYLALYRRVAEEAGASGP